MKVNARPERPILIGALIFEAGRGRQIGVASIASVLSLLIALSK